MTRTRAWSVATKTCAVFFALATALIGQGFTGAVEPDAGAMDTVSWIVIGITLFAVVRETAESSGTESYEGPRL